MITLLKNGIEFTLCGSIRHVDSDIRATLKKTHMIICTICTKDQRSDDLLKDCTKEASIYGTNQNCGHKEANCNSSAIGPAEYEVVKEKYQTQCGDGECRYVLYDMNTKKNKQINCFNLLSKW